VVSGLRRDLLDQRISEIHNILLGDLAYGLIETIAKELYKLVQTTTVKVVVDRTVSASLAFNQSFKYW
jgi:hypothetical protein